ERPDEDAPAVVAGEDAVSGDVIEREGEGREQGREDAVGIEMERGARCCSEEINHQSDSGYGEGNSDDLLRGQFLLAAGHDVQQNPDWSGVLHDDGSGHVGSLDGDVVEIV